MKNLAESLRTVIECTECHNEKEDIEIDFTEAKSNENAPPGFAVKKATSKVKVIDRNGTDLCFVIDGKVYDQYLQDYISSICPSDPEDIVSIFRKSGYTDDEIKNVFDEFWRAKNYQAIPLKKPVKVTFTVFVRKSLSMPKNWTP